MIKNYFQNYMVEEYHLLLELYKLLFLGHILDYKHHRYNLMK